MTIYIISERLGMIDCCGPYEVKIVNNKFVAFDNQTQGIIPFSNGMKYVYNVPIEFNENSSISKENYREKHYIWNES